MKSINDYLRTVLATLRYSSGELLTINLLWVLLMLPIITIPPAFAGLFYATHQLANETKVSWRTFFEGFNKYLLKSYVWFLANAIVLGLLLFNIDLALQRPEISWLRQLSLIYWVLLFMWLVLQLYSFPFLIEQDEPRLILAFRNSAILWMKHLFFNLFLVILIGILVVISYFVFPFWFVITASLIAYLSNLGLAFLLSKEKLSAEDKNGAKDLE